MERTLIIAHRGASAYIRENTMRAFRVAHEMGADMIELDVRMTGDGVPVVYHDEEIGGVPIREMTFGQITGKGREEGCEIPALKEVLEFASGRVGLDLEIKEPGYEEEIVRLALDNLGAEGFIITSSLDSSAKAVKGRFPQVRTGLILRRKTFHAILPGVFPAKRIRDAGVDILAAGYQMLNDGFLNRAEKLGKQVYAWTESERKTIWMLLQRKAIVGIVTDRPDLAVFLRALKERREP